MRLKLFINLFILLLHLSCTTKTETIKPDIDKNLVKDDESIETFENIDFNLNTFHNKILISWEIKTNISLSNIEVKIKSSIEKSYNKITNLPGNITNVIIDAKPMDNYKIKLVFSTYDNKRGSSKMLSTYVGSPQIQYIKLEDWEMLVYLPESYYKTDKRYPVIYMQDGQNLFESKFGSPVKWNLDKVINELLSNKMITKECIVVGVFHKGEKRRIYYIPYRFEDFFTKGIFYDGKGHEYVSFLVNKIIPYIDNNFRTIPDRNNRAIMGASLGGFISLWTVYNYPTYFSMAGVMSPYARWIIDDLKKWDKKDVKIWIDVGTSEATGDYPYVKYAREIVKILIEKGYKYGQELFYFEEKNAIHHESAWEKRVRYPLIIFLGDQNPENYKLQDFYVDVSYIVNPDDKIRKVYVNPIGILSNTIKFSLLNLAEYKVLNNDLCSIDSFGEIELNKQTNVIVSVKALNKEEKVTIKK